VESFFIVSCLSLKAFSGRCLFVALFPAPRWDKIKLPHQLHFSQRVQPLGIVENSLFGLNLVFFRNLAEHSLFFEDLKLDP